MTDNIQTPAGSGSDPYIKTTHTGSAGASDPHIQHVRFDVGVGTTTSQVTPSNPLPTSTAPIITSGLTTYKNLSVINSGVNIKASGGAIYGWYIYNNAAAVRYLKLYNLATTPTIGTDTPFITIGIPSASAANVFTPFGIIFDTGIGIGGTNGVADNNAGAPTANDLVVNIFYL